MTEESREVAEAQGRVLALAVGACSNPDCGCTGEREAEYATQVIAALADLVEAVRKDERERQREFHGINGAAMLRATPQAQELMYRIVAGTDPASAPFGVPWAEIRTWLRNGEDVWAVYLLGEAHCLATDHQSEVASLSVQGARWWTRVQNGAAPAEGGTEG